jgi:hypothetical protein
MRTKIIVATVMGGLLVALFAARGAAAGTTPGASKAPANPDIGRWQIVHGPPTGMYRTFLIDTATGASFIVCGDKDKGVEGWCSLPVLVHTDAQ